MISADSIDFPDSLKYHTKVTNRAVYGGGGIMPDIFIPIDTTRYSDYFDTLVRRGILNSFVLKYIDENREKLENDYQSFQKYDMNFEVSEETLKELLTYAENEGLESTDEDLQQSADEMKLHIKALIARDIWDMSEYFQVVNKEDREFRKAIKVLNNWEKYESELLKK
jgi:carboxyl-terminal processing protease